MPISIQQLEKFNEDVEGYLRKDIVRNNFLLYNLNAGFDLNDWYIATEKSMIQALIVLYRGSPPITTILTRGELSAVEVLIKEIPDHQVFVMIPKKHLQIVKETFDLPNISQFILMSVTQEHFKGKVKHSVERLSIDNLMEVDTFLRTNEADAWNQKQLEIGPFYCLRENHSIVSICGTLASYVRPPGVAVIGNLFTISDYRLHGFGTSVLSAVALKLFEKHQYVTLMVDGENRAAIRLYQRLGFVIKDSFIIGRGVRREI